MANVSNKLEFIFTLEHIAFHLGVSFSNYRQKHIEEYKEDEEYVNYKVERSKKYVRAFNGLHVKVTEDDTVEGEPGWRFKEFFKL